MRQLIVNADDFGLTRGINRAILELHRQGVLTSATLMANAPATGDAIALAQQTPSLGVGCHIVLVDGDPLLSTQREIPTLGDPITGKLRQTLINFLAGTYRYWPARHPRMAGEIEAETAAQIAKLQQAGLKLTHIDTHKHTHMFPVVLRPLLRAAKVAGIRAIRNPFEPAWSLRATPGAPWIRRTEVSLLRLFEPAFRRIVAEGGFSTTNGAIGVLATGTLNASTVNALLRNLPPGTWELVSHPGYNDADLARAHTRLLASRETEREALTSIDLGNQFELIDFSRLGEG